MEINYKYTPINKQTTKNLISKKYEFDEHVNTKKYTKTRPAQAISFSGSAVSEGQKLASKIINETNAGKTVSKVMNKIGDGFIQNKPLNKLIDFVHDNEAGYNAIYALLIAGILKPLLVLRTKDTDEKDKQLIATKNFLQAFLGSFLSFTISGKIIKKAVDITKNNRKLIRINDNNITILSANSEQARELAEEILKKQYKPIKERKALLKKALEENQGIKKITSYIKALFKKIDYEPPKEAIENKASELVEVCKSHANIFKKNPEFLKKLKENYKADDYKATISEAYDSFWKNIAGSPVAITKAKISSILLPVVVGLIFAKKNLDAKQKNKENKINTILNSPMSLSENFKNDQKQFKNYMDKGIKPLSFTGSTTSVLIDKIAKTIESASMSNFGEKCVETLAKLPKPSARMADFESIMLTGYWVQNTARSKKIDPDQKLGLNTQTVLVTVVSSAMAYLIDLLLDGLIKKGENRYSTILQDNIKELARKIKPEDNLKETIKESCKKLNNPEEIAKTIIKKGIDINNSEQIKEIANKLASGYGKKLSKFKSLTIFTLVVRFLVPVLMVKPSGKIKQKIKKIQQEKEQKIKNPEKETNLIKLKEKQEDKEKDKEKDD